MNRFLCFALSIAAGLCFLLSLPGNSDAVVLTSPGGFSWLLSNEDYGKVVGQVGVVEDLYDRGLELLKQGEFNEAAECFWRVADIYSASTALKDHTKVASAYYFLGKTYLLSGKPELSAGLFALAESTYPLDQFMQAEVDLFYSHEDVNKRKLRRFALQRQLELELSGLDRQTGPAEWEETVSMDALFDFNSYSLQTDASDIIHRLAQRIKNSAGLLVVIEAHSDDVGTQEYNLWLGNRRAEAVKEALVRLGVRANNVKILSYGNLLPVTPNCNEEGRAQNRRMVVKAIKQ